MFAIAIWWIWKWRNEFVFNGKRIDIGMKIQWIKVQYWDIRTAYSTRRVLAKNINIYEDQLVKWIPPPNDWCALNVDGCVKLQGQRAGGSGLLRDDRGKWIKGFINNIGSCTSEEAELWAVWKGLQMTWQLGHKKVVVGIDSETVVKWIHGEGTPSSSVLNLVSKCQNLLAKDWEVRVHHIYREQNRAADFLASVALEYERGWKIIEEPPIKLLMIMEEDRLGMSLYRRVKIN